MRVDLARPGFENMAGGERLPIVGGAQVEVQESDHETTVSFTFNPAEEAWLEPGDLALLVTLGNFEGAMSRYTLADEHFTDSRWTVGR